MNGKQLWTLFFGYPAKSELPKVTYAQPKNPVERERPTEVPAPRLEACDDWDAVLAATATAMAAAPAQPISTSKVALMPPRPFLLELRSERMIDAIMALDHAGFDVVAVAGTKSRYVVRDREQNFGDVS